MRIEQADAYKERVYAATVTVNLDKYCNLYPSVVNRTHERAGTGSQSPTRGEYEPAARVRLPKLSIRPFNGDVTKWTTFWDSFESAIDNSSSLTPIDKFNYLRSLVKNSVSESISGLTLSSDNYQEAVAILKKRFGNIQQIITEHIDIFLSLEQVSSPNKLR